MNRSVDLQCWKPIQEFDMGARLELREPLRCFPEGRCVIIGMGGEWVLVRRLDMEGGESSPCTDVPYDTEVRVLSKSSVVFDRCCVALDTLSVADRKRILSDLIAKYKRASRK